MTSPLLQTLSDLNKLLLSIGHAPSNIPAPPADSSLVDTDPAQAHIAAYAKKYCDARLKELGYPTTKRSQLREALQQEMVSTHRDARSARLLAGYAAVSAQQHVQTYLAAGDFTAAIRVAAFIDELNYKNNLLQLYSEIVSLPQASQAAES